MFNMESNNFDKHFREKLQNLKPKYRPEDWELMEQKLNDAEMEATPEFEDVLLDGIAFGSLENYKADFNPSHWDLMEQKLDDAYSFRRKLYRYKVAEVSLMLLAIFTIIQFLPFKKQKPSSELAAFENRIETPSNQDFVNADETSLIGKSTQPGSEKSNPTSGNAGNLTALAKTSNPDSNTPGNLKNQKTPASKPGIGLSIKKDPTFSPIEENSSGLKSGYISQKQLNLSIPNGIVVNTDQPVSLLMPIDRYQPKLSEGSRSSGLIDCPTCKPVTSTMLISIGMSGGADADYITTPYDDQYHQKEYGQIAMGYSGGVTLGIKYHKWELETGAIYSAKYYGSRNIFEVNGSFEEGGYVQTGLLGVQLDIVKLPLHLRYNFMNQNKWNVYAHSGASFNMTVETLYEYTSQNIGNTSNDFASRREDPHSSSAYNGIFEGGNFIDNTFITANLGLGVERHFNTRMSVFLGSTYQHQITKGLGPQNDKINSLSIMAGARVTLKTSK